MSETITNPPFVIFVKLSAANYAGYEEWMTYTKFFLKEAKEIKDLCINYGQMSSFFNSTSSVAKEVQRIKKKFPEVVLAVVSCREYEDWFNNRKMSWNNPLGEKNFDFSPYLAK